MKKNNIRLLLHLFWAFFKISPITFGGGFAMMPIIKKEVVDRRKWLEEEEIIDAFALAQSAPGSVGVNSSAFIGYRIAGVKGALAATIGVMIPTFFIVIILSLLFLTVRDNQSAVAAFKGIRPAVVALITYAAILTFRSSVTDKMTLVFLTVALLLLIVLDIHPVLLVFFGLASGIVIYLVKKSKKVDGEEKA
ncbi:chromate transporter [Sporosarcina sp. 179-K 3D1 HS]|uniref:chromate transporter n=1 Tax=Sporosarcina sp. 179-K 3D1 HS TaxID=3232169 RepID=UPI0039A0C25F